jgi:lipoprotein-anchoring transpeptidase ErfK/SrfK
MTHTRTSGRVRAVAFAAVGALVLALAACSNSPADAHWSGSADPSGAVVSPSATASNPPSAPAGLVIAPATGASNVAPAAGIKVTATGGVAVTGVTVTAGTKTVAGKLSADGTAWVASDKLAFNTRYTVKVEATGAPAGTPMESTFVTAKATKLITATMWQNVEINQVANNAEFGVGEPLIVHFNHDVPTAARAAVVKALKVTTTPAVVGRWHWIDNNRVDYRPEKYWPSGTKITLNANLYGVKISGSTYGGGSFTKTIRIGDSHVAIVDVKTHQMKVYINDKLARTVPVSTGMNVILQNGAINFNTRNGPHVVLYKTPSTIMSSGSYGLVDKNSPYYYAPETVYLTVKISGTGEYVHLRTWTTGDIGKRNTSHGCVNVGAANAQYMYDLLGPGDIVDVHGSPSELQVWNGIGDWTIPWSQW